MLLRTIFFAMWVGAVVASALRMTSPPSSPTISAWVMNALYGSFWALVGLFISRDVGIPREDEPHTMMIAGAVSAVAVVLTGLISRAVRAAQRRRDLAETKEPPRRNLPSRPSMRPSG